MKRLIAAVALLVLTVPVFAQSFDRSPTDPVMPRAFYDPTSSPAQEAKREQRPQPAAAGATRSDRETPAQASAASAEFLKRHVERQPGYFDPSR